MTSGIRINGVYNLQNAE